MGHEGHPLKYFRAYSGAIPCSPLALCFLGAPGKKIPGAQASAHLQTYQRMCRDPSEIIHSALSLQGRNEDRGAGFFLPRPHHKSMGLYFVSCLSFLWPGQLETPRGHGTQKQTALCPPGDAGTLCSFPVNSGQSSLN